MVDVDNLNKYVLTYRMSNFLVLNAFTLRHSKFSPVLKNTSFCSISFSFNFVSKACS